MNFIDSLLKYSFNSSIHWDYDKIDEFFKVPYQVIKSFTGMRNTRVRKSSFWHMLKSQEE